MRWKRWCWLSLLQFLCSFLIAWSHCPWFFCLLISFVLSGSSYLFLSCSCSFLFFSLLFSLSPLCFPCFTTFLSGYRPSFLSLDRSFPSIISSGSSIPMPARSPYIPLSHTHVRTHMRTHIYALSALCVVPVRTVRLCQTQKDGDRVPRVPQAPCCL